MYTKEERILQLLTVENLGRVSIKNIIDHYDDIEDVFVSSPGDISRVSGVNEIVAAEILNIDNNVKLNIKRKIEEVNCCGYKIYCYGNNDYPKLLAEIYDPPVLFYSDGDIQDVDYNSVAIVGTRKASEYGRNVAKLIAERLAASNITVVSGCAIGIDTYAHKGALESGGRTLAVLGSGLKQKYPRRNIKLMEQISLSGAVISEFSLNTEPAPYNFPQRNRIVSGLSLCVIVVEAPARSGALITAYSAIDQGRLVYAVPGNMFSQNSKGCNDLLKRGAGAITDPGDIVYEIEPLIDNVLIKKGEKSFNDKNISSNGKRLLDIIGKTPVHIDMLETQTKIGISKLNKELTNLEMLGRINQVGGKRYIKNG
jgi:DNA processing protein